MASKKGRKSNVGSSLNDIKEMLAGLLNEASKEMGINFEVELDEKKSQNNLEQGLKNLDAPPVEVEAKVTVDKTDVQKQADEIKKILNDALDFSGKKKATDALRETFKAFSKVLDEHGDKLTREMSLEGIEAGVAYSKAMRKALNEGVSEKTINQYSKGIVSNRYGDFDEDEFDYLEDEYKRILGYYQEAYDAISKFEHIDLKKPISQFGDEIGTLEDKIRDFVIEKEYLHHISDNDDSLFDADTIEATKKLVSSYFEDITHYAQIMEDEVTGATRNVKKELDEITKKREDTLNKFGSSVSIAGAPKELVDTYNKIYETISEADSFPTLEEAFSQLEEKAKELGVVFDNSAGKWVKATPEIKAQMDAVDSSTNVTIEDLKRMKEVFDRIYEEPVFGDPSKIGVNWAEDEIGSLDRIAERLREIYSLRNKSSDFEERFGEEVVALFDVAAGAGFENFLDDNNVSHLGQNIQKYLTNAKRFIEARKLLAEYSRRKDEIEAPSLISPTQEFDNEVQKNITYLENYKNTIKEIDRLKLEPETDETKKKLEELNKLAEYFISNITAIRSENRHTVSAEMMQFGGTWAPGLIDKYSNDQLKELYEIAHNNYGLQTNKTFPELQYIEDELKAIEEQSESTRQSLSQDLVVSKKYARDLADNFEALVETREELNKRYVNKRDAEAYQADIDYITKKYPEILELADKIKTYGEAARFVKTDEWLDFLATLPQAHKYLESIGYDFERMNAPKKKEYEYFKKTDEEIYASAMELAQKRENIFEEITAREIELANKMSGEVKTAYYDMAVASNEMFKKGASDYDIEDKIEKTDSLIKELEERLSNEDDPQMIMVLNHQLDEAKIKILALEEVFNHIKLNRNLFSSSDIDSDVIEKYWRTQRENFSIGNSNYSISTADREYWQSLTDGIDTEEKLAIAIDQRKNSLIALRQEISKAEDAESELYRAKEDLPYGKERDAKEEEWRKASDYTFATVEQYNEVREELYNLIQLHDKLGQSIENAPQINNTFLGSEWRQEEQAMNAIDEEIEGIIEARKKDAEAQKEEKAVTDENTESVERNAAAIKRLTQKVRDRSKGKKWNATPEIADTDFEGIISELKAAGATENDLQKVTDIFNEWKATLPSVSNVIEETTSEIKEEASVQDKIQQETEQTIKDTKEEANAHDTNAEAIDRESEAYNRALKNGRGYWDEKVASYYQDEKQEFLPPAIITPSLFVNANNSTDAVEKEAVAADNVKKSFEKAAKAKNKFNDANEQLDDLAEDGAESLEEEADALNRFPENADLLKFLEQIQEGTNTIEFGIQIDKEMAISELRKIAPEIADAFNELYGTNISSGQVVKAYQESQRQIEKLQKQQAMDDAMNYSKIQKQRAEEEKKAIAEINKARKDGQKQAEEYERNQVLTEESTIRKEMALMKQRRQEAEAALRDAIKNSNDEERIQVLREESTIRKEIENLKKQERADVLTEESTIRKALANKELLERNEALVEERTLRKELEAIRKQERADVLTEESTIRHALKERQDVLKEEEEIRTKLASMTAKANANAEKEEEAYINSIYKEREDNLNRIYALKNSNAKLDEDKLKNQSKIQANEDEIAQLEARNFDLAQQVVGTTSERVEEEERLVQLEKELADQVANTARTTSAGQFDAIEKSVKSYSKKLNDIIGDPNKDTQKYTQEYREKIEALNTRLEEVSDHLKKIKDAGIDAFDPKEVEALSAEYDDLVKKMDEALKGKALSENKQFAQSSLAKLRKNIEDIMARNSAMGRDFEKRFGDLKLRVDAAESVGDVERLKAEIVDLETELIAAGKTGKSAFQKFREAISTANTQFLMQYFSIQDFIRYGQQAFEVIRELDYALVDLKKTSDMTDSELEDFYYSSNDIAKSMGVTTRSIIEQAAQWSRLGYSTKEASSMMAELSSQFASISPGMGTEEAQLGLVSLMKAYHIETDEVERTLMDNINTLGNKFAETNQDIIEGMKRAGATLSAVGTSVEDSFALFTGAQEVIQNAETVGTALKTLSLRIRGYDEETEQLSEDVIAATGKVADLTKVASNGYAGVSLWADAAQTQYRSLKDYLGDIAEIWDEIDAGSQTELLDKLFGKRGASVGSAILGNFDQVEKAIEEMEKAAGAADAEMGIITESIDFKLNALKETWVGTIQELLNNKQLAKFIDFLTRVSEEIGKIAEAAGPFASLFAVGGIATIVPRLDKISEKVDPVLSDLFEAITKGELLSGGNSSELSYQTLSEGAQQIIDMKNNIQELIALNPKLAIGLGVVTAAVVAGAIAWDKYQTSVDEWQEKIAETESKVSSLKTEIEKLRDIDFRTQDEQDRLEILNKELAAQERILEVEKERALIQEYGFTTPAQVFDSKNANNRLKKVLGTDLFGTLFHSSDYIGEGRTGTSVAIENSTQKIVEYNQQLKDLNLTSEERIEITNKLAKEESHASSYYLTLTERTAEYEQEVENAKQAQEGMTDTNSDAYKNAQKLIDTYTEIINVNKAVIEAYEKATGKFDYSSIIESALSKVEFEGLEERLVGLAETGTLTEEKLKGLNDASLQALLAQLDDLGVSSEVFYNWLLRAAGLVDKGNLAGKIVSQMGGHDRGWQYDTAVINSFINGLNEDKRKIVAGLDIDLSAYTNGDEVVRKLQSEIDKANGNPVTVGVEFDQSAFSEQVNELDALQTAYNTFAQNVAEKKPKIHLDIKDIDALREKFGELEGFDEFELTVTSDTSGVDDIQKAFDGILTAYANQKIALDGITEKNKDMIRSQLEMEGATHESAEAYVDAMLARANAEKIVADGSIDLENATYSQINAMITLGKVSTETGAQLAFLALQEQLLNNQNLDKSDEIASLIRLAQQAGYTGEAYEKLIELENIYAGLESGVYGKGTEDRAKALTRAQQLVSEIQTLATAGLEQEPVEVNFDYSNAIKDASSAGSSAADAYVEAYQKEKEQLERLRDAGLISEKIYLEKLKALIDKYFKDRAEYAENYMDEMKDYMDALLTHYNSVISGVTTLLDKRINKLNKNKETITTTLTEEKEAAEERYQAEIDAIQAELDAIADEKEALQENIDLKQKEIDAIQEQIDAINEANEARDRSINLQKAEYELQRAQNQRTKLVYTGEVGQMR